MLKIISSFLLKISGWKIVDTTPNGVINYSKAVMIAAPHTSNWDYFYCMIIVLRVGLPFKYLAKDSLFKFPLGIIIRGLGGVPVIRSQKNNLVNDMGGMIKNSQESIQLIVPAEGTRSYSKEWKSGFYHIAVTAGVPIILGFLDFKKKEGGFLNVFYPTGNYEQDLFEIQKQYANVTPKFPEDNSLKNMKFD
ncbi:1-acyl-sn-glycerol-3-phosphate acyltransferase [Arcicella sp. LKC2W]|uniref:1-acyl-sn-glycerol-3-phosphate acyltransferase n=1 Tax=Arcicella sp. LKC2W TaxID=2984198 RepID=UPI002B1EB2AC|nr:1-acyl-sn-glycerol-3-phosphate acyltransferase [Arcicella sp. LKC2W]MEA5458539.1 1-acyl-sn-glycerol-3-phosphate acyltransferase [Arcicella sp. LKC2W]